MALSLNPFWRGAEDETRKLDTSIVAEPIEAWRIWRYHRPDNVTLDVSTLARMAAMHEKGENPFVGLLGPRLTAVATSHTWGARETARCSDGAHDAPHQACGCGLWAMKDERGLHEALRQYGDATAYGRVQLWGRIIEHKKGYRAQYARPLSVTLVGADENLARELADFYRCDVQCGDLPKGVKRGPDWTVSPGTVIPLNAIATSVSFSHTLVIGNPTPENIEWGFKAAVHSRKEKYPTLAQAVEHLRPAADSKIHWRVGRRVLTNHCQILRTTFASNPLEALEDHLQDVELTLLAGRPAYEQGSLPRGLCGGAQHYLGRDPRPDDHLALRPLRDLVLIKGGGRDEWLSEFSLEVRAA